MTKIKSAGFSNNLKQLLLVTFLTLATLVGVVAVKIKQDIRSKAAVPTGSVILSLEPLVETYLVGNTIETNIYFNTNGEIISGIATSLEYIVLPEEVTVSEIKVSEALLDDEAWVCPTVMSEPMDGYVRIDVGCANVSAFGFSSNENTLLATIKLVVNTMPQTNPIIARFDPSLSVAILKSTGEDVLAVPENMATYTILDYWINDDQYRYKKNKHYPTPTI